MAPEWQRAPLHRLLAEPVRNGIYKPKEFHGRGVKIVNMGELFAYPRLRSVAMKRVELSSSERDRFGVSKGDLLFARRSLVAEGAGKCSVVIDANEPTAFESSIIRARPDPSKVDSLYLYYFFNSTDGFYALDTIRRQVAVAGITGSDLALLEIPVPELQEQRGIAHVLGTLDDKIELNRRMNETLEAMARALFKSWFVDFDPVRAKMEGRWRKGESLPGLRSDLYDLFPARLVDSELGEIPEGWEVGRLGDVVEQIRDQENPLSSPGELFHHFSIPAFDEGQSPRPEYGESIKSIKSRVPAGAILLSKLNPEIERVWMVDVHPGERAVCSTEFLVLRARPPFARSYVYCLARSPLFRQQIEGLVTGTSKSHQRAQVASILNLAAVIPPSRLVSRFERSAANLLSRTLHCRRESRTLAALRDALLPKLISGELRMKDPGRFVERVT
ncbi:MAG: restriction endonuclease subunit S [Candidatus Eisenbacteria bacterium]